MAWVIYDGGEKPPQLNIQKMASNHYKIKIENLTTGEASPEVNYVTKKGNNTDHFPTTIKFRKGLNKIVIEDENGKCVVFMRSAVQDAWNECEDNLKEALKNISKLVKLPYAGDYETKSGLSDMSRSMILTETKRNSYIIDEKGVYKNLSGSNGMCRLCRNPHCGGIEDENNLMSEALGVERYRTFRQQLRKKLNDFEKISDITELLNSNYEKNVGYMVDGNKRVGFKKVDKLRCVMAMTFDISDYSFENIALIQNAFIDMLKKHMNDE